MASEPEDPNSNDDFDEEEDDDEVSSPFDHPFFLPVLLFAFAAWFGYDGWLNEEFAKESGEHLSFNRYGFGVLLAAAIYFTVQSIREKRNSESDSDPDSVSVTDSDTE